MVKRLTIVLSTLVLLVGVATVDTGSQAVAAERPQFIKIAGSSLAGTWFRICAMTAAVLNEKVEGTTFSATLGGGITNIKRIDSAELEMGLAMTSGLGFANFGTGPFEGNPTSKVAALGVLYKSPYHVVVHANSDIKSPADLADKEIAVGKNGWSTELFARTLLKSYDLSYDKIKQDGGRIHFVGWGPMARLMKDKRIDAAVFATAVPVPQLLDVTTAHPIRVLSIDQAHLDWFAENYPAYYPMTIPKGSYKGHEQDATTFGDSVTMTINRDIDADLVYEITKAMYENKTILAKVHGALNSMSPENALQGIKVKLHPGAYRYYKEEGIDVPAEITP